MLTIQTHNPTKQKSTFEFYILNKGLNSGKPLSEPCTNCFTCILNSKEEMDFYFWLCWGLWKSKQFEQLLCGSVIPFIRISELKKEITRQALRIDHSRDQYMASVNTAILIEEKETAIRRQLQLLQELKRQVIRKHIMQ